MRINNLKHRLSVQHGHLNLINIYICPITKGSRSFRGRATLPIPFDYISHLILRVEVSRYRADSAKYKLHSRIIQYHLKNDMLSKLDDFNTINTWYAPINFSPSYGLSFLFIHVRTFQCNKQYFFLISCLGVQLCYKKEGIRLNFILCTSY